MASLNEFIELLQEAATWEQSYLRSADPSAIDNAVAAWRRALDHPQFFLTATEWQAAALSAAGGALLRRYWARGRKEDLDQAVFS